MMAFVGQNVSGSNVLRMYCAQKAMYFGATGWSKNAWDRHVHMQVA